jgi:hypothetical protein
MAQVAARPPSKDGHNDWWALAAPPFGEGERESSFVGRTVELAR